MDRAEIDRRLHDLNVLIVEDNFLVAMAMQRALMAKGCRILGPVASVDEGLALAEDGDLDVAILDINITGGVSQPIADVLERRGLPFFFISGYGSPRMLPDRLRSVLLLPKPVNAQTLLETLARRATTTKN